MSWQQLAHPTGGLLLLLLLRVLFSLNRTTIFTHWRVTRLVRLRFWQNSARGIVCVYRILVSKSIFQTVFLWMWFTHCFPRQRSGSSKLVSIRYSNLDVSRMPCFSRFCYWWVLYEELETISSEWDKSSIQKPLNSTRKGYLNSEVPCTSELLVDTNCYCKISRHHCTLACLTGVTDVLSVWDSTLKGQLLAYFSTDHGVLHMHKLLQRHEGQTRGQIIRQHVRCFSPTFC